MGRVFLFQTIEAHIEKASPISERLYHIDWKGSVRNISCCKQIIFEQWKES